MIWEQNMGEMVKTHLHTEDELDIQLLGIWVDLAQ